MAPDDTLFGVVRNGVLTLSSFVTSISVYAGQLKIRDGLKGAEVELTLSRAHCPVSRIISLRGEGILSLAAARWLSGVGISLVHLDYDGTPLLTTFPTPRSPVPAALRRAQAALTAETRLGASIAQCLIRRKIAGQIEVLREFGRPEHAAAAETELRGLTGPREARTLDLLGVEGRVSAIYWQALADQSVSFGKRQIVPGHWQKFGRTQSPLTGENRGAVTPGNALINYLYSVAVSEITIGLHTASLDPFLGSLHTDKENRASLAYDLLEPCRPLIDRWFFHFLRMATFSKRDFQEDVQGFIRVTHPLTSHLAMTSVLWRDPAYKVVEWFYNRLSGKASILRLKAPSFAADAHRSAARWRLGKTIAWTIPALCQECGRALPSRKRRFCTRDCMINYYGGPSVEAGLAAIARARAAGMKARPRRPALGIEGVPSVAEWRQRPGWSAAADDDMRRQFVTAILPRLAPLRPSDIARSIGVTPNHAIRIRLGRIVPHPRFHAKLATLLR